MPTKKQAKQAATVASEIAESHLAEGMDLAPILSLLNDAFEVKLDDASLKKLLASLSEGELQDLQKSAKAMLVGKMKDGGDIYKSDLDYLVAHSKKHQPIFEKLKAGLTTVGPSTGAAAVSEAPIPLPERPGAMAQAPPPQVEPPKPKTADELLEEFLKGKVPGSKKDAASALHNLKKSGKVPAKADRQLLAAAMRNAPAEALEKLSVQEAVEGVKKGRLTKPGALESFLKKFTGMDMLEGKSETSATYKAEKALAEKGIGGFAGKGAQAASKVREAGRFIKRPANLLTALFAGLTLNNIKNRNNAASEVKAQPLFDAEAIQRKLEIDEAVAQRRVELQKDPELFNQVAMVLAGGSPPPPMTRNSIRIGAMPQKRSPQETDKLLDKLLLGLAKQGGNNDEAAVLYNTLLEQSTQE